MSGQHLLVKQAQIQTLYLSPIPTIAHNSFHKVSFLNQ